MLFFIGGDEMDKSKFGVEIKEDDDDHVMKVLFYKLIN